MQMLRTDCVYLYYLHISLFICLRKNYIFVINLLRRDNIRRRAGELKFCGNLIAR